MDNNKIEKDIQETVEKAVKKTMVKNNIINNVFDWILKIALIIGLIFIYQQVKPKNPDVKPVDGYDMTIENNGIFGFTAADFEKVILGQATRQHLLIVNEQEVSVPTTITSTGLFNLSVFSQALNQTIYGIGEYTIDITKITKNDILFDQDKFTVTINVPYPELHSVIFEPEKTKIGDANKGWLAFGDIKLTPEQHKAFEVEAIDKLTERLNEKDCFDTAERFTKLTAYELYQPLVNSLSPAYKVNIVVKK